MSHDATPNSRRFLIAECFLVNLLGLDETVAAREILAWGVALSSDSEKAVWDLLGHPTHCPHGESIPAP